MDKNFRKDVSIVFGETSTSVRSVLRSALASEGYSNVRECSRFAELHALAVSTSPDIIIADAALPGGDLCQFISDIRNRRTTISCFLPIIVTTWNPSKELVRQVIDAGTDDLLTKPVAPGTLLERIHVLATSRKPFIVTSDYIGPDRRNSRDRGQDNSIPYFQPPNPLGAKLEGREVDEYEVEQAEETLLSSMNDQRLKQSAFRICFTIYRVLPEVNNGLITPESRAELDHIPDIANELLARIGTSGFINESTLCREVLSLARSVVQLDNEALLAEPGHKSLLLLKSVAEALLVSFNPGKVTDELTTAVSEAIQKARRRGH